MQKDGFYKMSAQEYLSKMLERMQDADESRQVLSRLRNERDDLHAFWKNGALKCEILYNSLLRSNEKSIEAYEGVVKTYEDIAASYSTLLIRSVQAHHAYLEERRRPAIARPCGF